MKCLRMQNAKEEEIEIERNREYMREKREGGCSFDGRDLIGLQWLCDQGGFGFFTNSVITYKSDSITAANENCWYLRNSILQIEFFITLMVTFWMHLQLSLLLLLSCHWASSMLLGWVESPGYPHGYLPHTTLNWSRCARKGHVISLQLIHLDLEDSQNCENDAVKVGLQQNQEPSAAPLFQTHFSLCTGVCRRKPHLRSVRQKSLCWASVVR